MHDLNASGPALRRIGHWIRRFRRLVQGSGRQSSPLLPEGFHGDQHLMALVSELADRSTHFLETGTNVGSTLVYMASSYPNLSCLSCEPDRRAYRCAHRNTRGLANVRLFNERSQDFIERIGRDYPSLFQSEVIFWLDAHGSGYEWPLKDEIRFITRRFSRAYVLIDDFKVPDLDIFEYNASGNQACSFDYIKDSLEPAREYGLYYPCYENRTSRHHPLRGWCLLSVGQSEVALSPPVACRVRRQPIGTLTTIEGTGLPPK